MGIPRYAVSSVALWLALSPAWAQAPPATEQTEALDEIVVSGEYPGPGLWKVTRADDAGHVMWIVGEPPPLPKRMKWKSKDVEAVALSAQEILLDSAVRMDADEKIGFFRGITLVPAILEARRNPGDAKLKDLVTTPAGCTIDGILELEDGGLRVTLIKAVVRATQRARELLES